MFAVLSALVTAFFNVMDINSFFGHSLLVVAVVSSIGIMVSTVRRLMWR